MALMHHMKKILLWGLCVFLLCLTFACEQKKGDPATAGAPSSTPTSTPILTPVPTASLLSIDVSPANASTPVGVWQQMTATGIYSDNSHQDLTRDVVWSSSNNHIVNIDRTGASIGRAVPTSVGTATITASQGTVLGSTTLNVTEAVLSSISITPNNFTAAIGVQKQFRATGVYSDNSKKDITSEVSWSSDAPSVVTIGNVEKSKGMATAVGVGTANLSAQFGSVTNSVVFKVTDVLPVSLAIEPKSANLLKGAQRQMTVMATYPNHSTHDLTGEATWTSSAPKIAQVGNTAGEKGVVTGVSRGGAVITAQAKGLSARSNITVVDSALTAIAVSPENPTVSLSSSLQFTASGTFSDGTTHDVTKDVTWTSIRSVIAMSNSKGTEGLAVPQSVGSSPIQAALGAVLGGTTVTVTSIPITSLSILPIDVSTPLGVKQSFTARVKYANGREVDVTKAATWSSSDPTVATISNSSISSGVVTSLKPGSTQITAMFNDITSSPSTLTVRPKELVSIDIEPHDPTITLNQTLSLRAIGTYTDGTTASLNEEAGVNWASSRPSVVGINAMSVTGLALGNSIITATVGSIVGKTTVLVINANLVGITVNPNTARGLIGRIVTFQALGQMSNGTSVDITEGVTWTSSNPAAVDIVGPGKVKGLVDDNQTVTVKASVGSIEGTATYELMKRTVTDLQLTVSDTKLIPCIQDKATYYKTYKVIAIYVDGTQEDVGDKATWSTDRPACWVDSFPDFNVNPDKSVDMLFHCHVLAPCRRRTQINVNVDFGGQRRSSPVTIITGA